MKEKWLRLTALVLAAVLLTGCQNLDFKGYAEGLGAVLSGSKEEAPDIGTYVTYEEMEYSRPDLQELEQALAAAMEAAEHEDIRLVMKPEMGFARFQGELQWGSCAQSSPQRLMGAIQSCSARGACGLSAA